MSTSTYAVQPPNDGTVPMNQDFYARHAGKAVGAFLEPEIVIYGSYSWGSKDLRPCARLLTFFLYFRPKNLVQAEQLFASKADIETKLPDYKVQLEFALSQKSGNDESRDKNNNELPPRKRAKAEHIAEMCAVQRKNIYGQEGLSW